MHLRFVLFVAALCLFVANVVTDGNAQNRIIALKSGETVELHTVYWVSNCRSIMIGIPEVEVLEGGEHVTLSMKKDMVLPRRQECPNKVPGGVLTATAKEIKEPMEGKLTYRLKYKIKDGDRPRGYSFRLSLFP